MQASAHSVWDVQEAAANRGHSELRRRAAATPAEHTGRTKRPRREEDSTQLAQPPRSNNDTANGGAHAREPPEHHGARQMPDTSAVRAPVTLIDENSARRWTPSIIRKLSTHAKSVLGERETRACIPSLEDYERLQGVKGRQGSESPRKTGGSMFFHAVVEVNDNMKKEKVRQNNNANDNNAKQALDGEKQDTIWNAVKYAHHVDTAKTSNATKAKSSWEKACKLHADDSGNPNNARGVFGETALHQAVLYAPQDSDFWLVKVLWENYPSLRVAQYTSPEYKGENALHLAIARKLPRKILELFLSDPSSTMTLLLQKANGTFFSKDACGTGKELNFGETPLGFAACTNQQEYFDMLLEACSTCCEGGATQEEARMLKRKLLTHVTDVDEDDTGVPTGGYSLLHLMVLHSTEESTSKDRKRWQVLGDSSSWRDGGDGGDDAQKLPWYCQMYDHIEQQMRELEIYEGDGGMATKRDAQGYRPLALAASRGSLQMFNHLLEKKMTIEWEYGPVKCRKLFLQGVDVPFGDNPHSGSDFSKTVLEEVVDRERLDILEHGTCLQILDKKWETYAKKIFRANFWGRGGFCVLLILLTTNFWGTCSFCVLLILLTTLDIGESMPAQAVMLVLEAGCCMLYFPSCKREVKRLMRCKPHWDYWKTNKAHLFERLYAMCATPICTMAIVLRWVRCASRSCEAHGGSQGLQGFEHPCSKPCRQYDGSWLQWFESSFLLMLSFVSFGAVFRGMMGFSEYGQFVLMLIEMIQQDILKFMYIYVMCLVLFSHMLNVIMDKQNSGWQGLMEAVVCIFAPALDQFEVPAEISSYGAHSSQLSYCVIYAVIICNFFLVSLVLINLVIAMMSSTYDNINRRAKSRWNHCRAAIITNLDKDMEPSERESEKNKYWGPESSGDNEDKGQRYILFTSSDERDTWLSSKNAPSR